MSTFTLHIETDNAAFEGDASLEVASILRELVGRLEHTSVESGPLHDVNGNPVGRWQFRGDNQVATSIEEATVLVVGDAIDGLTLIGPFVSTFEAQKYAESATGDNWVSATLHVGA